jgi:hypothetical protein
MCSGTARGSRRGERERGSGRPGCGTGLPPLNLAWLQVKRLRNVYPVFARGYREHLAVLEDWADRLERVTTFGRQGLFTPDNTGQAIVMGYAAADSLCPGGFDLRRWATSRDGFADHLVDT